MDEAETKTCTNCKREIPAVNFTIHTVHCARNIKVCPVCKEPVPQAELQEHHEKLHKLLPCKKCGESVCGTDLEDHVRDSCAHTIKSCRFCELELPRRELPAHEGYCGVRTEQCAECREWVMIKYRQLHHDSNHGFLRLDDDPVPQPRKEPAKITRIPKLNPPASDATVDWFLNGPSTSSAASTNGFVKNTNVTQDRPRAEINRPARAGSTAEPVAGGSRATDNQKLPLKRTNDQPQINTSVAATDKLHKDLGISRGAVKKRQAPRPPLAPPPDPRRDCPYYSAVQRAQAEQRQRDDQSAINIAQGLPPVLSPAAKLDRLRKMDALHNRETEPPRARDLRHEFKDIKPMNPEEFRRRFQSLQVNQPRSNGEAPSNGSRARSNGDARSNADRASSGQGLDRFSEIKSSLMALRRGLNEVTAPYNFAFEPEVNNRLGALSGCPNADANSSSDEDDVRLPCEFCARPILVSELVIHQTGCRPDLAQLKPRDTPANRRPRPHKQQQQQHQHQQQQQHPDDLPVIPCEFCTESLPVYLISEHQERCRRDGPLLYPD